MSLAFSSAYLPLAFPTQTNAKPDKQHNNISEASYQHIIRNITSYQKQHFPYFTEFYILLTYQHITKFGKNTISSEKLSTLLGGKKTNASENMVKYILVLVSFPKFYQRWTIVHFSLMLINQDLQVCLLNIPFTYFTWINSDKEKNMVQPSIKHGLVHLRHG